jgi:ribonuclease T1
MLPRSVPRLLGGLFLCLTVLLTGCSATDTGAPSAAPSRAAHMATVKVSQLPAEARQTLTVIDKGGPFPYAHDGTVFGNREHRLPGQPRGYYHEYTVRTPGAHDRGARRIVTGLAGEIYYTEDHYNTFRTVLR